MKGFTFVAVVVLSTALGAWSLGQIEVNWHTPDYLEKIGDGAWNGERFVSQETMSPLGNAVARMPKKIPALATVLLLGAMATYHRLNHKKEV